ncbi:helix-turn-helix transcriptional regulator [Haloarchaeobius sp. DFWS5]|uniref:helix-turn-helix transcriptional regulator n=1 Tax=Haloarchaeobius sp. DFWS5 TaxID=3446114 RepID=UPI003EC06A38
MRRLSAFAAALLVIALFAGVGSGVSSDTQDRYSAASTDESPLSTHDTQSISRASIVQSQSSFEPADPATVITINLTESGDARWTVSYRYILADENETAAFESYGQSVVDGQADVAFSPSLFQKFAAQSSETTGREMQIANASWADPAVIRQEPTTTATTTTAATTTGPEADYPKVGVLSYSFTWTNFTETDGNQILLGDVFGTENETWFPRLYDGQRLVINEPTNYAIIDSPVNKGPQNSSLVWDGPQTFRPEYIEAVYVPREDPVAPGTTPPGNQEDDPSALFLGAGVVLLVVLVGAGSYLFARWQTERELGEPTAVPNGGTTTEPPGDATSGGVEETDAAAGAAAAGAGAAGAAATDEGDGSDDEPAEPEQDTIDVELLSDEERVLRMLRGNGGRMKQANIVKETGWSNAKVSQLLSGMDDDDEIEKLRIGRENLITLPGESIGDFDDE